MSNRYDIVWNEYGPSIQLHFCRDWDEEGGCYGTNRDHGMSFGEAKQFMVEFYEERAKSWRKLTHEEFQGIYPE